MMNEIIVDLDLFLSETGQHHHTRISVWRHFPVFGCVAGNQYDYPLKGRVADFIWSLAIVLTPILALIALPMVTPEAATDTKTFLQTGHQRLISSVGASVTATSIYKTFMNSISNSGVLLLSVVFALKIGASVVSVFMCLGIYKSPTEKHRSVKKFWSR